ncbi:hypothetical protein ABPG72_021856 [Tetrahymena utriculariae]
MCYECFSKKNTNFYYGILASISISLLHIYEFVQLSKDQYLNAVYAIIIVWMISKVAAFVSNFKSFERDRISFYLLFFILQCEWYCVCKSLKNQSIRMLIQLVVIALPTACINIYMLSLSVKSLQNPFYTALIFINFSILWILTIQIVMKFQKVYQGKLRIHSAFLNLCTIYILVQSFIYSKFLFFFLLIFNFLVGALDFGLTSTKRKQEDWKEDLIIQFCYYVFSMNLYPFQTYQKFQLNTQLPEWEHILKLLIQCINLVILALIKFQYFALVIQLDIAIYVLLFFCLPQFYLLTINVYYKSTKHNKFKSQIIISDNQLHLNKKLYSQLQDRFVQEYKLNVRINLGELNSNNIQKLAQNLTILQKFMKAASKSNLSSTIIYVSDSKNTFECQWRFQKANFKKELLIGVTNKIFNDNLSLEIFLNMRLLLIENIQHQIQIISNQIEKKQLKNLLSSGQFLNFQTYKILELSDHENTSFNETITQLAANNFQVVAFYKSISQYSPINPTHLLYDLYCYSI